DSAVEALTDPVWQFVPWIDLARREIAAGRAPLWNPHQDGGVPLLGNGISALGSPLLWPALAAGVARGWNPSLLLRLLVAVVAAAAALHAGALGARGRLGGLLAALPAALIGAGLAAPLLFPFLEYYAASEARTGIGRHPFVLSARDLLRFVIPGLRGSNTIEA